MWNWLRDNPKKRRQLAKDLAEAAREAGVLLMAFTLLEGVLRGNVPIWPTLTLLFTGGTVLFVVSFVIDWRNTDDR